MDGNQSGMTEHARYQKWFYLLQLRTCTVLIVVFSCGVCFGLFKWPPIEALRTLVRSVSHKCTTKEELLRNAFRDPVNEKELYYPAITSLSGIREANERLFICRDGFEIAYENIQLLGANQLQRANGLQPVVRVRFSYLEREYEAFAYGNLPKSDSGIRASLVIPGSGLNQSLGIATDNPKNYHHGILDALTAGGAIFTLIKPNEDFLAWHDGKGKKLRGQGIWSWQLNRGGSYAVTYVVHSLAIMKWMKSCFSETIVAGLSQGGAATLSNALQSQPTHAIVASGSSILFNELDLSSSDQLMGFPDFAKVSNPSSLLAALQASPTSFLFSWGREETDYYKIEAEQLITAKLIEPLANVEVAIHDGGHVFPVEPIRQWLSKFGANR
jgi:hypothetical protein